MIKHRQHLVYKVRIAKLVCADIDSHGEVGHVPPRCPGHQLGTGSFQHPMAQGQDQPRLLGQGNEFARGHEAAPGMLPAHQRLGARYATTRIHLGLVVE